MKNLLSISLLALILTGCSTFESTIQAGKDIASAMVDDAVDVSKTVISIPVQAVGTVVDKLEEETVSEESETE
jgi:PBP1b-binding outer membrane lipoprotein LpoB